MSFLAALKSAKGLGIMALCLSAGLYVWFLNHNISSLKNDLSIANQTIGVYKGESDKNRAEILHLQEIFNDQRATIDELKLLSEKQIASLKKANLEMAKLEQKKQKLLAEISRIKVGNTCEEAIDYLRTRAPILGSWENVGQ